eukprot:1159440-Pelagomonas_calceolata.AAC.15
MDDIHPPKGCRCLQVSPRVQAQIANCEQNHPHEVNKCVFGCKKVYACTVRPSVTGIILSSRYCLHIVHEHPRGRVGQADQLEA